MHESERVKSAMKGIRRPITERRGLHGLLPPVEGVVYDEIFAIHRDPKPGVGGAWCVTHLPTGYILCTESTKRYAQQIVASFFLLPVPWKTRSPHVLRRYRKVIFPLRAETEKS